MDGAGPRPLGDLRKEEAMTTETARELDEQLVECKAALQGQAQAMLTLLVEFEARLQERLDAAEARIATIRSASAGDAADCPSDLATRLVRPGSDRRGSGHATANGWLENRDLAIAAPDNAPPAHGQE